MGKAAARGKDQVRYLSQEPGILQLFRSGAAKDWFRPGRELSRMLKLAAHLLRSCREGNFAINSRRMEQQWAGSGCAANAPDQANLGATLLPEIAFGHNGP